MFYRENSVMTQVELSDTAKGRVTGMVELRQIVNELIDQQLNDYPDEDIQATQAKLNAAYDAFTAKYGLLNDRKNGRLFEQDSSYYLLCSLENLDEQGQLKSKAAMFTKRTIRPERTVTSVDTPSEALAVSIGEHGRVDLPYMAELLGTPGEYDRITTELSGVIFKDPAADPTDPEAGWQMADEYLSGDVRAKLRMLAPISLFVAFLALMAKWLLTLSSYVVAPLMLYIFGCGIYTVYRQTWDQFLILLVAEFLCFVLFVGATAMVEGVEKFSGWLRDLI